MRRFNVLELKTRYIHGEIEDFCIIVGITEDEFYKLQDHEELFIWDHSVELLKKAKIFEEWY
jgi:hypothetical protein